MRCGSILTAFAPKCPAAINTPAPDLSGPTNLAFQVLVSVDISDTNDQNARLPGDTVRCQDAEEQSVANSKQSAKRARQGEKRRQQNVALRSRMRTAIKGVLQATETGDADKAAALYKETVPKIDTMVNKGLIHKNKAARTKSRLNTRIRNIGA